MDKKLRVRFVASNNATREKGLMFADPLNEDEVALFVFPHADRYAFWNKNVSFGLTLAFIDENGKALEFADLEPGQLTPVAPKLPARFVVEAQKGSLAKLGIQPGDLFLYDGADIRVATQSKKLIRVSGENRTR